MSNNESEVGQSLKQIIEHRLEKIKILKEGGVNPFPHNFDLKDKVSDLLKIKDPFTDENQTAGRVVAMRKMGKASFCHIQYAGNKIQIYLKSNNLTHTQLKRIVNSEHNYNHYKNL